MTRAKQLELHIQTRIHDELSKISDSLSTLPKDLPDTTPSASPTNPKNDLSRTEVQKSVDELRRKLENRRLKEDIVNDKAVEKAKTELVACFREKDRRPLDCWREVEAFKREVGRLEGAFVSKILE